MDHCSYSCTENQKISKFGATMETVLIKHSVLDHKVDVHDICGVKILIYYVNNAPSSIYNTASSHFLNSNLKRAD